ncbi:MAG: DUF1080 domain-containing protein [Planctomycetota bacterium]|nr:DUF1080 domain-containing protein [Planctomycetota bacterium]
MKNLVCLTALALCVSGASAEDKKDAGWISLFDGKSLDGWKASENKASWKVTDGALVCQGTRSHLFYMGDDKPFKNFEFQTEVMTTPGSNAGIYFHTKYQETGWPKYGFEAQVNITHGDAKKSGSLYGVVNVANPPAKDNEWHTEYIKVEGKRIIIKINDKVVVDYTEPKDHKPGKDFTRAIDQGTFAFQAHDPKSKVHFRNVKVRRLAD